MPASAGGQQPTPASSGARARRVTHTACSAAINRHTRRPLLFLHCRCCLLSQQPVAAQLAPPTPAAILAGMASTSNFLAVALVMAAVLLGGAGTCHAARRLDELPPLPQVPAGIPSLPAPQVPELPVPPVPELPMPQVPPVPQLPGVPLPPATVP